jgi:hypothetical protein
MNTSDRFKKLYDDFNRRNIDAVFAEMSTDIEWANGMEGGHVHGHHGVRDYWTRQFTMVQSQVTPEHIFASGNIVRIKVHQVVHDLSGNLLADQHVTHVFQLVNNKIARFDIE